MVSTFCSWLDLQGVVLAFWIFILLNIFESLQKQVKNITSYEKRFESFLGHILNFCPNLVHYLFKNMFLKKFFAQSNGQTKEGQRRSKFDIVIV